MFRALNSIALDVYVERGGRRRHIRYSMPSLSRDFSHEVGTSLYALNQMMLAENQPPPLTPQIRKLI